MDNSKRRLLGQIAAITAGAVFIPLAEAENLSTPASGKRYGMLIDLRCCVGCQACTVACTIENQPPLGQFRTTVNQYEVTEGGNSAFMMLPRLCNHCENPPCIPVCPTGATFQREDGIVVVNNKWCVGCGYCVQACPYDARFINHDTNTADKCTFCAHRLDAGLLPACVETCVGEARIIGDLNDPDSKIRRMLSQHKDEIKVLRPSMGTGPRVFYLGMDQAFEERIRGEAPVRTLIDDSGKELSHGH
ncbi:sulfate reduction electron transfer complex DsrMKJOP subunit DsrO [Shewanella sp. YIC-542]|uniref:sulfate reduction electron transfer complex DsrMKJOP subunit DsrO n=1 Tax=Shewanella mytili TaxID=3377111 RepID=UPI00398F5CF0